MEALRIGGRAHAQAQQDLWYQLSQIFEQRDCSDEILAIHLLQSLEHLAADPKTHQLLPGDTVAVMREIHNLLVPHTYLSNPGLPPSAMLPGPNRGPENPND
jgi:hypothetical protein